MLVTGSLYPGLVVPTPVKYLYIFKHIQGRCSSNFTRQRMADTVQPRFNDPCPRCMIRDTSVGKGKGVQLLNQLSSAP